MPTSTIHKASELSPDERRTVERLLGRKLEEDETFGLSAPVGKIVKEAPRGAEREAGGRELIEHVRSMSAQTSDVAEEELNALIDEAFREVRRSGR